MREPRGPGSRPVFLDRSGRRRRLALLVGTSLAIALLTTLGLLIAGLSAASPVTVPGFPEVGGRVGGGGAAPTTSPTADARPPAPAGTPAQPERVTRSTTSAAPTSSPGPGSRRNPTHPPHPRPSKNK